jgi:hypothetical protein
MMNRPAEHFKVAVGPARKFPCRPDAGVLNESIRLFFIGRNRNGFWITREAEGRAGGIFLSKRSAQRFAEESSVAVGCATMFLAERFELDMENQGSPGAGVLDAAVRAATPRAPRLIALVTRAFFRLRQLWPEDQRSSAGRTDRWVDDLFHPKPFG